MVILNRATTTTLEYVDFSGARSSLGWKQTDHQDLTRKRHGGAMRFIVMVKANKDSESGVLPTEEQLREMGKFNDELAKAGVMLAGGGLPPSSQGDLISLARTQRTGGAGSVAAMKETVA